MAPITPERHMKLLNMAWNRGVDKEAVEKFLYMNMAGTLQALRIMKSDDFAKGYEMAMQHVKDLMKCTVPFARIAEMMNGSFPDIPEDFYENNIITKAHFINYIDEGCVTITYDGSGFTGKITLYINEFLPCSDARLRKVLKEYREPLGGEYAPLCWALYHWLEDLSKYCGVRGKAYGNKVLKNMDVLAKELGIQ